MTWPLWKTKSNVMWILFLQARGIDVQQVSLVINYDLPGNRENYIHRLGMGMESVLNNIWSFFWCFGGKNIFFKAWQCLHIINFPKFPYTIFLILKNKHYKMKMGKQWFLNKFLSSGRCMTNSTVLCLTEKLKKRFKEFIWFWGTLLQNYRRLYGSVTVFQES